MHFFSNLYHINSIYLDLCCDTLKSNMLLKALQQEQNMKNITSFDEKELTELVVELGQPKFRGKQLYEWLHKHNVRSYDEMKNLPKALREELSQRYPLSSSNIRHSQHSADGSKRYLFDLSDGNLIETVAISDDGNEADSQGHLTVCVSSQVGCSMLCAFCATGQQGFTRNLSSDEILDQVVYVGKDTGMRVSNVVVMGQGEPFNNYDAVMDAVKRMNTEPGLNIGARHITISTSGIIKGIDRFTEEPEQFRLAVSLHSAIQSTRNLLMPKLASQTLSQLKSAIGHYNEIKGRRVTLEYLLLEDVNDSEKELNALIDFCDGLNVHVNLLHYNATANDFFESSSDRVFKHWIKILSSNGIKATTRKSRGSDISAACGQLKNEFE